MSEKWLRFLGWESNLLKVWIKGKVYLYTASPFVREKFERLLQRNQGKALTYLKKSSKLVGVTIGSEIDWRY